MLWVTDNFAQVSGSKYISLKILVFQNSYKSLTIDPFNTIIWDFATYSMVFLFILVIFRNYKN